MGYIFAYQEKTGMGIEEIMRTPWLMIVLGMLTAPSIDYDKVKEERESSNGTTKTNNNEKIPQTAKDEMAAISGLFG